MKDKDDATWAVVSVVRRASSVGCLDIRRERWGRWCWAENGVLTFRSDILRLNNDDRISGVGGTGGPLGVASMWGGWSPPFFPLSSDPPPPPGPPRQGAPAFGVREHSSCLSPSFTYPLPRWTLRTHAATESDESSFRNIDDVHTYKMFHINDRT